MMIIYLVVLVLITLTLVPPNQGKFSHFAHTNTYNVWIRQPLYATTIWDVKLKDWEYEPIFTKDVNSNTVEIKLQQVPPED